MLKAIRRLWWRVRGRCALCGAEKLKPNPNDMHSLGPYCRKHNKIMAFSVNYGMGPKKLKELLNRGK